MRVLNYWAIDYFLILLWTFSIDYRSLEVIQLSKDLILKMENTDVGEYVKEQAP